MIKIRLRRNLKYIFLYFMYSLLEKIPFVRNPFINKLIYLIFDD